MDSAGRVLGRAERTFDLDAVRDALAAKAVLVTGAGGVIGGAVLRKLLTFPVSRLAALDTNEHALVDLLGEVGRDADRRVTEFSANVRDAEVLSRRFGTFAPDIVIHAAALKHVDLGTRHPGEYVLTNLVGLVNVIDAAENAGASLVVLISADKAAAPTSVVGVCKRLGELYAQTVNAKNRAAGKPLRIVSVRLGNVLGAQQSVVTRFKRQIAAGGPVTLTHASMRRYFMSAHEAVSLILTVSMMSLRDTTLDRFVLDMGRPIAIRALAEQMIARSGREISIVETGIREGEKLEEDLYDEFERLSHTGADGVLTLTSEGDRPIERRDIARLGRLAREGRDDELTRALFALLKRRCGNTSVKAANAAASGRTAQRHAIAHHADRE